MKRILLILTLVTAMVANAYCAYIYESEIQSFGNYDMVGKTFYIISADSKISNKDLEFQEYKDYITQCLIIKKAILCENSDSADVCILFDYGVVDKSYVANVPIPIWGRTGATFISTTSRYLGLGGAFLASGAVTTISTGISGIINKKENISDYRRIVNIYAYDNKDRTSDPVMLWKTNIASSGTSRDLQEVLPYISYAAIPYMGKQSDGVKIHQISPYEMEVFFIRNKYYTKKDLVLKEKVKEANGLPIEVHSVYKKEWGTTVNLIAEYVLGVFTYPKFKRQTYLVLNDQKYPLTTLYEPCEKELPENFNLLNTSFELDNGDNLLQMNFPVTLQKGDTFDIVSYSNKRETKIYVHFKNIVVQ